MKLVELLAKELKEWPEDGGPVAAVVQDPDRTACVRPHDDADEFAFRQNEWIGVWHNSATARTLSDLATDHATAIVTRAQWEAEKARIAGKVDGGWIRHKGVNQPVADWVKVEIRTRGGDFEVCSADGFAWGANGAEQIMAYRIHNPVEQPAIEPAVVENVQAFNAQAELLYDPVAQGPLQWRDRIYELDTNRAELEATYQRQVGEIAKERGELVERLAGEGLALVEVVQPVEDMSDWRNWKVGDLVEVVSCLRGHEFNIGEVVRMKCLPDDDGGRITCEFEDGSDWWILDEEECKWHSRPAS